MVKEKLSECVQDDSTVEEKLRDICEENSFRIVSPKLKTSRAADMEDSSDCVYVFVFVIVFVDDRFRPFVT